MKKGQTGEGFVKRIEFPNKGIIYTEDGEKVVVKNALTGQKVRFQVNKKRKGKCEGRLLEVLEKSPLEREEPFCVHFGSCGGCSYQNLDYKEQLQLKESQVLELLLAVVEDHNPGNETVTESAGLLKDHRGSVLQDDRMEAVRPEWFEGIKPAPKQSEYRNKMEYTFGDEYKDGPLALGMHKRGSFYDLVTVSQCRIVDPDYNLILSAVLSYFRNAGTSYFHKNSHEGYLRHLLVRKASGTGEILADLVTTSQPCGCEEHMLLDGFCKALLRLNLQGRLTGILHTKNDGVADVVKDEGTDILYGRDYFYEQLLGLKFKISPFSFFQTNTPAAEVLYETVREFTGSLADRESGRAAKVIYDLYSGTGTIAQLMAPVADKVIGVEIVREAVEAARENARENGLDNCEFIAGDVWKALDSIKEKPDFIIMDPPREGIHPKALEQIIAYGVERMVYVSCKPVSLARDLKVLQAGGYVVERCCCIDQFPGTVHVETVVKLSLKKDTPKIEVTMEPNANISNYKPKERVTYQKIIDYVREQTGLHIHTSYIAQIKEKCGLDKQYTFEKEEGRRVSKCPPEKEVAIMDAFRHFGWI